MTVQFSLFSLLVVFLARLLMVIKGQSMYVNSRLYPTYGVIIGSLFALCIFATGLMSYKWTNNDHTFDRVSLVVFFWGGGGK